ncbi:hypothetical protein BDV96DRAFT_112639 [Lophiotrema nucula]|uniref:Uncharacterized protein n=1 Tax=Lophiotrema nucula TaxID=690887 RepID=A0A6A5Z5E1_9PLEO|nr:hypothetical protein BDV96DRAFT_112639 [Lophiotrema nucula]
MLYDIQDPSVYLNYPKEHAEITLFNQRNRYHPPSEDVNAELKAEAARILDEVGSKQRRNSRLRTEFLYANVIKGLVVVKEGLTEANEALSSSNDRLSTEKEQLTSELGVLTREITQLQTDKEGLASRCKTNQGKNERQSGACTTLTKLAASQQTSLALAIVVKETEGRLRCTEHGRATALTEQR